MAKNRLVTFERLEPEYGIPYSRVHLSRLERDGKFPERINLGGRVAWPEDEIEAWINARRAERNKTGEAA